MTRVFVVEQPRANIDISKAEAFGAITYIFAPDDRRCSVFQADDYAREIAERLHVLGFDPLHDLVCIAGSMVPVAIALAKMGAIYDMLRVLLFSARENGYVERVLDLIS